MLLATLLAVLLLASCNIGQDGGKNPILNDNEMQSQQGAATENQQEPGSAAIEPNPEYRLTAAQAAAAVDAISSGLELEGPGRAQALSLVSKLPPASAALFRDQVTAQLAEKTELDRHELAAWLAVDPDAARERITAGLNQGDLQCLMALVNSKDAGRKLLDSLTLAPQDTQRANLCLDLLRTWGGAVAADEPLLRKLAQSEDMNVAYRAKGYLLAIGAGGDKEFDELRSAVREQGEGWIGAIEGIKISGDERFADALVPLVGDTELQDAGDENQSADDAAAATPALMAAYALSYLPGEQAAYMRKKLLGAVSQELRWHACLGQLMHGDPDPWNQAVAQEGIEDQKLWIVLEPPEARHLELLQFYQTAADSPDELVVGRAVVQLSRYNGVASGQQLAPILGKIVGPHGSEAEMVDETALAVRRQALITAGDLKLTQLFPQILEILQGQDASLDPAAAYFVLAAGTLPAATGSTDEKGSDG